MKKIQTVDNVCKKYGKKKTKIKTWYEDNMFFIESDKRGFVFLSDLFLAHSKNLIKDCGFEISPSGAGSNLFIKDAKVGIYLHKIPCKKKN